MATIIPTTYIVPQIPVNQNFVVNVKPIRSSSAIQSQISPITHKDQLDQYVVYSQTPQRITYSNSVDNLLLSQTAKEQSIINKYPTTFQNFNSNTGFLSSTGAIIQDYNQRFEQKESPYSKLNPMLADAHQIDFDIKTDREKSFQQERKINELVNEIQQLKNRLGDSYDMQIKTNEDGDINQDYMRNSNNFPLNINVQQACQQFVLLCAENERLTLAYLQKDKEVMNLQNEVLQLKSAVLLESTKQAPFAQQLDIEAKLKVFEMRNESLHQQKLELQNKEYDYLKQIEQLSSVSMVKDQQIQKMLSDHNLADIEIQNLVEQLSVLKRQYTDIKDAYEKQSNNLAQLDFQKLSSSQTSLILTEKENIIFQKNQEIAEFKNYVQILEKDVQQLQDKFNQDVRNQMTVTGKYDKIHSELQEKYENHERLHNELKEQYEIQEQELLKTQGHCELLLSENEKLSYSLMARIEENEALKEEIQIQSRVQMNYDESQTMINELKVNIDKLLEDNKTLYEVNRQQTQQIEQNQQNIKTLESCFQEKEDYYQQQKQELEQRIYGLNKQVQQRHVNDSEQEYRHREDEKAYKECIFENEKLKSMLEIKDIKLKELQFQIDDMNEEFNQLQQTKQGYQILQIRCQELENQSFQLQEECNNWKVKYSTIESQQTSVIEELKYKLKSQCKEDYDREQTWIKAKLEANESHKDQIMIKLASYEQKSIMAEHQLKDIREKYANKSEEYDQLYREYTDRKSKAETLEKQYFGMQEKHLIIRIENERLHSVLQQVQKECDEVKRQFDINVSTNRKQHTEVYKRMQEYEEINRHLKGLISEYQDEIQKLEKINYNLKQCNFKIDEYENRILFLNREYEQVKLRLIESENQKQEFKIQCQDSHNSLLNYQQMDQQLSYLTKENERLQKLVMERCRQSGQFW